MSELAGQETFEAMFAKSGVPAPMQIPDNYFMYDAGDGNGFYAVPKQIVISNDGYKGTFNMAENGAAVSVDATVEGFNAIGRRAIVMARTKIEDGVTLGPDTTIGEDSTVSLCSTVEYRAQIGNRVYLGSNVTVGAESKVGDGSSIGYGSTLETRVKVDEDVKVDENVKLGRYVSIGSGSIISMCVTIEASTEIGNYNAVWNGAKVGAAVKSGANVRIGSHARIGNQSILLTGTKVDSERKLPAKTILTVREDRNPFKRSWRARRSS